MQNAWKNVTKGIFRLESIPTYKVPSDLTLFKRWQQGKLDMVKAGEGWLKRLQLTSAKGIKIERVRIVPLPLSRYLRYEIDFWKYSQKLGEKIFFLESKEYGKIIRTLSFRPIDFWMFDDETLILFHYKKGNLVREEFISDKKIINEYKNLKNKLLWKAISIKKFLKEMQI